MYLSPSRQGTESTDKGDAVLASADVQSSSKSRQEQCDECSSRFYWKLREQTPAIVSSLEGCEWVGRASRSVQSYCTRQCSTDSAQQSSTPSRDSSHAWQTQRNHKSIMPRTPTEEEKEGWRHTIATPRMGWKPDQASWTFSWGTVMEMGNNRAWRKAFLKSKKRELRQR